MIPFIVVVSITAHDGVLNALRNVTGQSQYAVPPEVTVNLHSEDIDSLIFTLGVAPVILKGTDPDS